MSQPTPITHAQVFQIAWPIILANAAVPLLGIVDATVIGNTGNAATLGAIALGAVIMNFVYWGFGFLRMGTTGITAQALGAGDDVELAATVGRAALMAGALGLFLLLLQWPLGWAIFQVFPASETVETGARTYFEIRVWGAPAALFGFAALGWFIGIKHSGYVLVLQVLLNGLNILLDVWFVVGLDMGVAGVAYGTVIAEWTMAAAAAFLIWHEMKKRGLHVNLERVKEAAPLIRMIAVNRDIFIRTLALVGGFTLFNWESARMGDLPLAANFILMQFIMFGAFFLDGFAYAVEALVGESVGAKNPSRLRQAVRKSTEWAIGTAVLLALGTWVFGSLIIHAMTNVEEVRATAHIFLWFVIIYPLIGVWPFQFDGIFIGATRTQDMRNAMILSFLIFLGAWYVLTPLWGNWGLWTAFLIFLSARGVTLGYLYPALAREVAGPDKSA